MHRNFFPSLYNVNCHVTKSSSAKDAIKNVHNHPEYMSVCLWRASPQWARASSFTKLLDHTQRRTTVGKTPLDGWSARRTDNSHNRQTSMPPVGFETTISANERPQTYALDCAATGTGSLNMLENKRVLYWQKQHDSYNTQFTLQRPTFREQRMNWRTFIHTYLPPRVTFAITSHNQCAGYEPWRDTTTWIAWFPAILTGNMITWSMLWSPDFLASVRTPELISPSQNTCAEDNVTDLSILMQYEQLQGISTRLPTVMKHK